MDYHQTVETRRGNTRQGNIKSSEFPISLNFTYPLRKTIYPQIYPKITKQLTKSPKRRYVRLTERFFIANKNSLKRVKTIITSQNTVFRCTPDL